MKTLNLPNFLWGDRAKLSYLILTAAFLLLTLLGAREIWTQEHRWADIVSGMFFRQDFLHPYLGSTTYYDKPLLSYWLIAVTSLVTGLNTLALRLPSALAGILSLFSLYWLGCSLKNKQLGFLSAWLMLTTYYFIFWSRTSSADMLNLAGGTFAVAWYMAKREQANFFHYAIFFLVIALTSLCKGLVGAIVPGIAVLTDIVLQKTWKQHLRPLVLLSVIPALIIYLLPFWASSHFSGEAYGQNGLYLVYKENILRYFKPFDHKGPIYTYFLYLPLYLMPWAIFFIPALFSLKKRWQNFSLNQKWIVLTTFCLFLFFTVSGSRRSYYVLPLLPFALLLTADWLLSAFNHSKQRLLANLILFSFMTLFIFFDVAQAWYYSQYGINQFTKEVKKNAEKMQLLQNYNVVLLDGESKIAFYLNLPPSVLNYDMPSRGYIQTSKGLAHIWPVLNHQPTHTIFITRKRYLSALLPFFKDYQLVEVPSSLVASDNSPIAFIPIA